MAVVLVLERALDLKWEVVVHLEHHVEQVGVLLFAAPSVEDKGPENHVDLAEIEAALKGEVGVHNCACEDKTGEAPGPFGSAKEL